MSRGPRHCIACGCPPVPAFRLPNGARLLRCPRCRLGWWTWPEFDPATLYDGGYFQGASDSKGYDDYAALEPGFARTARQRLRRIAQRLPRSRRPGANPQRSPRLLELGCGPGVFLGEARRAGWDVQGVEVSEYAAELARRRGLPVVIGTVEGRDLGSAEYDCVALWDVIEHLRDPSQVLRASARALRPGGILALSTGDMESLCAACAGPGWHLFNLPEHLFFFTPASLRALLRGAGAEIGYVTREVYWVPMAYMVERVRKTGGRTGNIARAVARLVPGPLSRLVLPATLLDVLGVYARRCSARRGGEADGTIHSIREGFVPPPAAAKRADEASLRSPP